jgi:glycosyltransferase involved in cell wall biosynthesis
MQVTVACPTKFHAFALAEQLDRHGALHEFHTVYHERVNSLIGRLHHRKDPEAIDLHRIRTYPAIAPLWRAEWGRKIGGALFDRAVSRSLEAGRAGVFVGWSGLSLRSLRAAKRAGLVTVVERGSTHVLTQEALVSEEFSRLGRGDLARVMFNPKSVADELACYEAADYISIPSQFVRRSFVQHGFDPTRLLLNNYGVAAAFVRGPRREADHLRVLYLGAIEPPKGLHYLLDAWQEVHARHPRASLTMIGAGSEWYISALRARAPDGVFWRGFIPHHQLPKILGEFDVAVQPSVAEGLSMVIPQLMASGIPVVATTSTGAADIIRHGVDGWLVPPGDQKAIADVLLQLMDAPSSLPEVQERAAARSAAGLRWNDYGDRYVRNLEAISQMR